MLVTVKSIKACYNLLKVTAFNDIKLPTNVKFKASRMDKYLGLYFWPDQLLVVNSRASTIEEVMKIVAHEMCHAAAWLVDGVHKPPHGKVFQQWASRSMRKITDVEVTTTHDYHISYKFAWACTNAKCNVVIKRHSRSVDTNTVVESARTS